MAMIETSAACKYHPEVELIYNRQAGESVCPTCGMVAEERCVDQSSEWRMCSETEDQSRVGRAEDPLLENSGLSTSIAVGYRVSESDTSLFLSQRRIKAKTGTTDDKLIAARKVAREICARLGFSENIVKEALEVYKRLLEKSILSTTLIETKVALCVYIGSYKQGVPTTLKDICRASRTQEKEAFSLFKKVVPILGVKEIPSIQATDLIALTCNQLGMSFKMEQVAKHVAQMASNLELVGGRRPDTIAGAAVFLASQTSGEKRSLEEVSAAVGIGKTTVQKAYRDLLLRASKLFPEGHQFETPLANLPH